MTKDNIQSLLNKLYGTISFEAGEEPEFEGLVDLFVNEAVVIEYRDKAYSRYIQKHIEDHINELTQVFRDYPVLKSKGFIEKEINNEITLSGPMAFVKSIYEKSYYNGTKDIYEVGTNCMQIAKFGDELKIISIGWYENNIELKRYQSYMYNAFEYTEEEALEGSVSFIVYTCIKV